jgi:hypothetical protein
MNRGFKSDKAQEREALNVNRKEHTMLIRKIIIASLTTIMVAGSAAGASAATWAERHPRRDEVNDRLTNQNLRIHHDLKAGKITMREARQLHRDDRQIRTTERVDAKFDHGHLTKADQRSLNQDENAVSRDIHRAAH